MGIFEKIVTPIPEITDTFCPECTYNLRGIPETRCPECGFGFEREAIRDIAELHLRIRLAVYRRTLKLAIWSLVFSALAWIGSASASVRSLGAAPVVVASVVEVGLMFCLAYWASLGQRFFRSPITLLAAVILLPAAFFAVAAAPISLKLAATLAVVWIAPTWIYLPGRFRNAALSLTRDEQDRLRRWNSAAAASALAAAVVVIFSWI